MTNRFTLLFSFLVLSFFAIAQPKIKLDTFARTFAAPVDIANDGSTKRMFIVQQNGIIWTLDSNGAKLDTFIDLRTKVQYSPNSEQGLLGMAFHPDYQNNGYFYTYYTVKSTNNNNIVRYKVSANPNRAARDSGRVVINIAHPFANHNGGCIKFGSDGFLYVASGDGGSGGDPNANGQNKNSLLGKILRLNVNRFDTTYTIPASNPFVGQTNVKQEIWAYGLRNPWRFSFDRQTNDLWIADVGQGAWEEVNFQASTSNGGENYGWRCYEGTHAYNTAGCAGASTYKMPIFEYDHGTNGGVAVTGGFVYRGNKYPDLSAYYICADYASANFWLIKKQGANFISTAIGKPLTGVSISSFGEDIRGELYAANVGNGVIYKIRELCSPFRISLANKKDPSCFNTTDGQIQMNSIGSNGAVTFSWTPTNTGNSISNLSAGKYVVTATDAIGCVRKDSFVLVKPDTVKINLVQLVNPSCPDVANGSIQIQGTGGNQVYTYSWNNGNMTSSTSGLSNGKYILTLKDSNNCIAKDSFLLVNLDTLDKPTISIFGGYLKTQSGFSYKWYQNGNLLIGSTQDTIHPNLAAYYKVEITDINGCKAVSDSIYNIPLSTNNKNVTIEKFSVFPNPAYDKLSVDIDFKTKQTITLKIINAIGQIVYDEKIETDKVSKVISLQTLPKGLYQLAVFMQDGKVSSQTFVKE